MGMEDRMRGVLANIWFAFIFVIALSVVIAVYYGWIIIP